MSAGKHRAKMCFPQRWFVCPEIQHKSFHSFLRQGKNNPLLHIYFDVGRFDLPAGTVNNLTYLQANETTVPNKSGVSAYGQNRKF
jgi:hypothetical protein